MVSLYREFPYELGVSMAIIFEMTDYESTINLRVCCDLTRPEYAI